MSSFNPQKLSVKLIPPATFTNPIEGRKYTLTHSDVTAELYLDIGREYNYESINWKMRDEVLAEWVKDTQGRLLLIGKAHVDGSEFNENASRIRFAIFKKEMDTALKGIVYGDRPFYHYYPSLLDAPIYIHYDSAFPQFNKTWSYGTPRQYLKEIYQSS